MNSSFISLGVRLVAVLGVLGITACSTSIKQDQMKDIDLGSKPVAINNQIPFTPQTPELCGPTAMYMAMKPHIPELKLEEITQISFTPGANGTYKQDLLAAARRLGMATYPVATLYEMMDYLADGTPIVLFHSTAILWKEFWHYSVLTGYNSQKETFYLHIGDRPFHEMKAKKILNTWSEGGYWAYVLVPPGKIPKFATLGQTIDNGLAFLRLQMNEEARLISLESLRHWPSDYQADVILADVMMRKQRFKDAYYHLKLGVTKNPGNIFLQKKVSAVYQLLNKN